MAGPIYWPDEAITTVASYVIETGKLFEDVEPLLRLIGELDRRGSFALSRKLLDLIPSNVGIETPNPNAIANIVSISRRHRLPSLLSRCILAFSLSDQVINLLSIEDMTWVFQSRAFPKVALDSLSRRLSHNARFSRTLNEVQEFLSHSQKTAKLG
jgi:hypothetical protein